MTGRSAKSADPLGAVVTIWTGVHDNTFGGYSDIAVPAPKKALGNGSGRDLFPWDEPELKDASGVPECRPVLVVSVRWVV